MLWVLHVRECRKEARYDRLVRMRCKYCSATSHQVKNGKNRSGSQRWYCQKCERTYTPRATPTGYGKELRQQAIRLHLEGMSYRGIGRVLGVHHQSIINWLQDHADQLPEPTATSEVIDVAELDELYTFMGKKSPLDTESTS